MAAPQGLGAGSAGQVPYHTVVGTASGQLQLHIIECHAEDGGSVTLQGW